MIHTFYTYLHESRHQRLLKKYLHTFPLNFQERLSNFKRWTDQQASLLGRILLREGIEQLYQMEFPEIIFGEYGKPYFKEGEIQFNISHSHHLVVCAITESNTVGIDIEYQRPIDIQDFKLQMTEKEWEWISIAKDVQDAFYEYWTKKEAVIKAIGKGLSVNLKSFEVLEGTEKVILEDQEWCLLEIAIDQKYSCHLAASTIDAPIELAHIQF